LNDTLHDELLSRLREVAMPLARRAASKAGCHADDIINEACFVVLTRPAILSGPNPEASFILVVDYVGKHAFRDHTRHRRRNHTFSGPELDSIAADADTVLDAAHRDQVVDALRAELNSLPRAEAQVLRLHLDQLTLVQIAAATGRPLGTVTTQYVRARQSLSRSSRLRQLVAHLLSFPVLVWDGFRSRSAAVRTAIVASMVIGGVATTVLMTGAGTRPREPHQDPSPSASTKQAQQASAGNPDAAPTTPLSPTQLPPTTPETPTESPSPAPSNPKVPAIGPAAPLPPAIEPNPQASPTAYRDVHAPDADNPALDHVVRYWEETGTVWQEWHEHQGKRVGTLRSFTREGALRSTAEYVNGKLHGKVIDYAPDGVTPVKITEWRDGRPVPRSE